MHINIPMSAEKNVNNAYIPLEGLENACIVFMYIYIVF